MVIPWVGFPLAALLRDAEPSSRRAYVAFTTLLDPTQLPGHASAVLDWPYVEGLRLDEAMHPLTLPRRRVSTAASLPNQNGAPSGSSCPWKVRLQGHQVDRADRAHARTAAHDVERGGADEYGFYANVNPPWTIRAGARPTERRIGRSGPPPDTAVQRLRETGRRPVRRAWTCRKNF
jgi:sulfoxide reductase catalytic subunit YedY